jgi:hypothetical protein
MCTVNCMLCMTKSVHINLFTHSVVLYLTDSTPRRGCKQNARSIQFIEHYHIPSNLNDLHELSPASL